MGFSTSGSLLVIFFSAFLALGTVYTAGANTTDHLSDGYGDQLSQHHEIQDTAIDVSAVYHETDSNLTIRVDNVGSTELTVNSTDVLVDGEYRTPADFEIRTVEDRQTDLWGLAEQLRLENQSTVPDRVHVVTETGVTGTTAVDVFGLNNSNPGTLDRTNNGTESTIAFDIESSYDENITLQSVTVDAVDGEDPDVIEYANDPGLSEVNITLVTNQSDAVATADGSFAIGEQISHDAVEIDRETAVRYRIGEFRTSDGTPVAMPSTSVTITITFEDPYGVERTFTFTEDRF